MNNKKKFFATKMNEKESRTLTPPIMREIRDDDDDDDETDDEMPPPCDEDSPLLSPPATPIKTNKLLKMNPNLNRNVNNSSMDDQTKTMATTTTTTTKGKAFVYILAFFAAIGGFLFGYDTGVVSGAMLPLRKEFVLSPVWVEVIVSATIAGAAVSALLSGVINDLFGRRPVILIASVVFGAGAIVLGVARDKAALLGGRIILGVGIGLMSMTTPMYIAEVASPDIRGRLITLNNVFITGGQFVASVVCAAFIQVDEGWRYMLGVAAIPAVVQFVAFLFLPESPRWLVLHGQAIAAKKVLRKIRDNEEEVDQELGSIEADRRKSSATDVKGWSLLVKMMQNRKIRRSLIVGCSLQMFQQIAGINTVMYYSATIIKMSGVTSDSAAVWLAALTAFINFAFTFVGLALVERVGRRKLTLVSLAGVTISLAFLAIGFQLSASDSPNTTSRDPIYPNTTNARACAAVATCTVCAQEEKCGFCYEEIGGKIGNASCLPVEYSRDTSKPTSPYFCNATTTTTTTTKTNATKEESQVWAYDYCPSRYAWMSTVAMVIYLMFFAPGMGPMPWTINAEIYPNWARSMGIGIATSTNWFFNLLVSMTFLTLTKELTPSGAFWLYAGFAAIGFVFLFFTLPETRDRSLEEIEKLFGGGFLRRTGSRTGSRAEIVPGVTPEIATEPAPKAGET